MKHILILYIFFSLLFSNSIFVTNQCNMQFSKHELNVYFKPDSLLSARDRDLANKPLKISKSFKGH